MAVRNFRIGNDLVVLWAICNRDGSPYNLADKQVRLFVMNERGRKEVTPVLTALPDGTINNVIRWDFLGMEQRVTGLYTLSVEIFTSYDKKSIKKDYCEAFCLVGSSSLEDEDLADNISDGGELTLSTSLDVIQLTAPRIEIGTNGNWIIDGIDSNVSALGGGPGLVNRIYDYHGFGKAYDPESVIDTFNAHAINTIYESVQDAVRDIRNAESAIGTLESEVELLKQFGGGGSGSGGNISDESLAAIMNAISSKADKSELNKYLLLSAASQTIKGDITIDGNLIVRGDMASAGTSTNTGVGGSSTLADLTDVLLGSLNDGDLLSWNGSTWVNVKQSSIVPNLTDYATKSYVSNALTSYATKGEVNSALSGYLPRSGGTIDGSLQVVSQYGEINLYNKTNGNTGWFFYNGGYEWKVTDNGWQHDYALVHSGNIGEQSVGSLNENELLIFEAGKVATIKGWHNWGNLAETSFATYTHGIAAYSLDSNVCHYIGFGNNDATPYIKSISYGNDSGWKRIALTDSTVAAAYRLVTPDGAYMIHLTDYTLYIGDTIYLSRSTNLFGKEIALRYGASATYGLVLNQSGNVIIGSTSDNGAKLQVAGDAIITGDLASGSDIRFKDIIDNTSLDISDIANAPLFTFKWNDREDNNTHLGTSAQYWEDKAVGLVSGEEFKTLNYASLGVAMGISLAKKVKELEDRINELETENRRLQHGS